jgi:hypothetical protein
VDRGVPFDRYGIGVWAGPVITSARDLPSIRRHRSVGER